MNGDNEQYFSRPPPFMRQTAETLAVLDDRLRDLLRDYARREPAHDALAAEFLGGLFHKLAVGDGSGIDRDLVGTGQQ